MPKLVVGAAIVDSLVHPTRLLAAQRSYPESLAGLWEFPGGKVEPGETPEAGLQREISEELSTALVLGDRVSSRDDDGDWPLPNGSTMRLWLAELADGAPSPQLGTSHRELRWVRAAEISGLPWLPGDLQILPVLLDHFTS
ncbi:MAG: NUDIX domain-containing protein [Ancrocorticia sp.]